MATKNKLVEAHVRLLREGDLAPTAARIAEGAGVSLRTLWTVFSDMEELLSVSAGRWAQEDRELHSPIDPALPRDTRVDLFCDERQRRLEFIAPAARAVGIRLHDSPVLRETRRASIAELSQVVEASFAPELRGHEDAAGLRDRIVALANWDTWAFFIDDLGYSPQAARAQLRELVHAVLSAAAQGAGHDR